MSHEDKLGDIVVFELHPEWREAVGRQGVVYGEIKMVGQSRGPKRPCEKLA